MTENAERSAESEPWWPEFVTEYKKVPLRELARRFNTNPRRLRRAAQRCGLEDEPEVIRENVQRLGTAPDPTLADHLGVTPEIIKGARTRRNIPPYDPTKPKPKTSRKSNRRAPPPRVVKPPRMRPDPMLVEVVRRGTTSSPGARDPAPATPPAAPPRPAPPPRPELRPPAPPRVEPAPERRWRGEERPSWGRNEYEERPRFDEGEERRRRLASTRTDDNAFGERRRIIQTSPRSGESVVRRVADAARPVQGARAPATPAAPAAPATPTPARRPDEDFDEYARRRIRESGRRLAEAMEEIEGEPADGPRPRRRIVSVERLEELRETRPEDVAPRPPAPDPEAPPPRAKRVRAAPPLPVRTLFDKDQGSPPPAELLRDLPPPPEPMISEHIVPHRPAVAPPPVAAEPVPAPVVAQPIASLRFWQAILRDGRLLVIAAADLAAAARLAQANGEVMRLEPAALFA